MYAEHAFMLEDVLAAQTEFRTLNLKVLKSHNQGVLRNMEQGCWTIFTLQKWRKADYRRLLLPYMSLPEFSTPLFFSIALLAKNFSSALQLFDRLILYILAMKKLQIIAQLSSSSSYVSFCPFIIYIFFSQHKNPKWGSFSISNLSKMFCLFFFPSLLQN